MLARLKPYPMMKDSGIEWLGYIPDHWELRRLKSLMSNIVEPMKELNGADPYVALENVESWTGRLTVSELSSSFDGQVNLFESGDVLFGKLRPYLAKVTRPTSRGVCVGEFLVLRPRSNRVVASYVEQWLRSKPTIDAVSSSTFGAKMPRANWQFVGGLVIPVPSVPEQTAIVRFLDHADRLIQRYIFAKQKLIALLEEQKQASIHQAVTGQIDLRSGRRYTAYKSSGLEWLKEVPAHWTRCRLKSLLRSVDKRSKTGRETLLSLRRDHGVVAYADHFARPSQGNSLVGYKLVSSGQLVVNRMQANNGLVFRSKIGGLVSPDYSVFEEKGPLQMQFLSDLLRTPEYRTHFRKEATGLGTGNSGFLRLYDERFLDTIVFLPPREEQVAVLEYLSTSSRTIDRLKLLEQRVVEQMEELRTRLVADVVTGKLDVRDSTTVLPNVDTFETGDSPCEASSDEMQLIRG